MKKVYGFIFFIMSLITLGLIYFSIKVMDMYHNEKRKNEKVTKDVIKFGIEASTPPISSFNDFYESLHKLNDISKEIKECCCTNSQKKQTV